MEELSTAGLIVMHGSSDLGMGELLRLVVAENKAKIVVQIFDPSMVISKAHLISAYMNAAAAFKDKTNVSSRLATEMLLFAAMTRKINNAIDTLGAKDSHNFIIFSNNEKAMVNISRHVRLSGFSNSAKETKQISKRFGISSTKGQLTKDVMQKIASTRLE